MEQHIQHIISAQVAASDNYYVALSSRPDFVWLGQFGSDSVSFDVGGTTIALGNGGHVKLYGHSQTINVTNNDSVNAANITVIALYNAPDVEFNPGT